MIGGDQTRGSGLWGRAASRAAFALATVLLLACLGDVAPALADEPDACTVEQAPAVAEYPVSLK